MSDCESLFLIGVGKVTPVFFSIFGILLILVVSSSRVPENIKNKILMINIPHSFVDLKPRSRGFLWVCVGFIFAVFAVLMIFIVDEYRDVYQDFAPLVPATRIPRENVLQDTSVSGVLSNVKSLTGVIDQVTTLKDGSILFFRVRSSLIDRDAVSLMPPESQGSGELPMVEKLFDVSLSENTTVKGVDSPHDLVSGDFVRVSVIESVYDTDRLTAESIEKIGSVLVRESE